MEIKEERDDKMNIIKIIQNKKKYKLKSEKEFKEGIYEIEKILGCQLPNWYKEFMSLDLNRETFEIYYEDDIDYDEWVTFLDFERIKNELSTKSEESLSLILNNKLIPLADDNGGGDYFYLQLMEGNCRVVRLYHDVLFEFEVVSSNIEDFFREMIIPD